MREIKFRIWDSTYKKFVFFEGIFNSLPCDYLVGEIGQQYTGLKDRNGKDIYEGDLINFSWQVGHEEFYDDKNQEVFYNNESASFVFGKDKICMLDRVVYDTLEVVGNVFENPELL